MTRKDSRSYPGRNLLGAATHGQGVGVRVSRGPSGVQRAPAPHVSLRTSALSFLDGGLEGWGIHQLVTWTDQCLIRPGRLITLSPFPRLTVRESGVGELSYGNPDAHADPAKYLSHARCSELIRAARAKVIGVVAGLIRPIPDDRFVQGALYDGRVTRVRGPDGHRGWDVMLTEQHALSDQVIALLAADLLCHRSEYEQDLILCSTCEKVDFWPERLSRRGCPDHPEGLLGSSDKRVTGLGR